KGTTAQVRAYGDRLVRDHNSADQRVLEVAEKQGIPVGEPTPKNAEEKEEMKEQADTMEQLQTLEGREFDHKLLEFLHKGHKSAIRLRCAARGKLPPSSPLPSVFEALIPILRQHYQIAIELEMDAIIRGGD